MGKDRSGGKTIYVRKGETKEDAAKRYEESSKGSKTSEKEKRLNIKKVSIFDMELGKAADLQGTQKQVEWAESIREKMVDKLKNSATYEKQKIEERYQRRLEKAEKDNPITTRESKTASEHYVNLANSKYKEDVAYAKKERREESRMLTDRYVETLARIRNAKDAKWFIDRRSESGNSLMKEKKTMRERMQMGSAQKIRRIMQRTGKLPAGYEDVPIIISKAKSLKK